MRAARAPPAETPRPVTVAGLARGRWARSGREGERLGGSRPSQPGRAVAARPLRRPPPQAQACPEGAVGSQRRDWRAGAADLSRAGGAAAARVTGARVPAAILGRVRVDFGACCWPNGCSAPRTFPGLRGVHVQVCN